MSYILDALRRADSDRERGAVPSLHSNAGAGALADAEDGEGAARSVQPLWWAVGGLSIALLAMMGWLVFGRASPQAESVPAVVAAAPTVTPAPVMPLPPPPMPEAPSPLAAAPEPAVRRSAPPATELPSPRTVEARPAKPPVKPAARAPVTTAPATETEAPVPSISELPDDVRRQLPALSVSGASYSRNPGSRMLILNGQVFREGDKVANDVVLEQIRLKSALLSFRGRRYSISF
jgi:general secretion pathway protein B